MSNILRRFCSLAFLAVPAVLSPALAQAPHAAEFPVGHWVAEHPSGGGIGSWWDFQPGGKVKMYVGVLVYTPASHTADTVTLPSGTINAPPVVMHYKIVGDTLKLRKPDDSEPSFTRVGAAPSPSDPLLGRWRPNLPKTPGTDQQTAAHEKAMANGLYVFSPDTLNVRIPFTSRNGTWDPVAHTLQIEGVLHAYRFHRAGKRLVLTQVSDAQKNDTYLPDPLFP